MIRSSAVTLLAVLLVGCDGPSSPPHSPVSFGSGPVASAPGGHLATDERAERALLPSRPASSPPQPPGYEALLNLGPPPPERVYSSSDFDPEAARHEQTYEGRTLVSTIGRSTLSPRRFSQSLLIHLQSFSSLADASRARRRELPAITTANSAFSPVDVASSILTRSDPKDVARMRASFLSAELSSFAVALSSTTQAPDQLLSSTFNDFGTLSSWRRDAIIWLVQVTQTHTVERHIALRMLPYVLAHTSATERLPSESELMARADAIAVARVGLAVSNLTDPQIYAVVANLQSSTRQLAFVLGTDAMLSLSDRYLASFSAAWASPSSVAGG